MKKEILVLTATLGDRESLQRTVDSVSKIGGTKVKHIIVTPNNRVEILAKRFPTLEILAEPTNCKGIYGALNYGFNKYGRDYKYLTFINDDDYWLSDYTALINAFEIDKSLDFVYGKIKYYNEDNIFFKYQACSYQFKSFLSLLRSNIVLFTQQATLIRSELFFKVGGFSEDFKLISDTKFWIDLSLLPINYKYINKACAAYTIHTSGQLSSDKVLQKSEHEKLLKMYPKQFFLKSIYDKLLYRLLNLNVYTKRIFK